MGRVTVFVRDRCRFCSIVLRILGDAMRAALAEAETDLNVTDFGLQLRVVDVTNDLPRAEQLVKLCGGARTVPQVFFNDEYIGDCSSCEAFSHSGALVARLLSLALRPAAVGFPPPPDASIVKVTADSAFCAQLSSGQLAGLRSKGIRSLLNIMHPGEPGFRAADAKLAEDAGLAYVALPPPAAPRISTGVVAAAPPPRFLASYAAASAAAAVTAAAVGAAEWHASTGAGSSSMVTACASMLAKGATAVDAHGALVPSSSAVSCSAAGTGGGASVAAATAVPVPGHFTMHIHPACLRRHCDFVSRLETLPEVAETGHEMTASGSSTNLAAIAAAANAANGGACGGAAGADAGRLGYGSSGNLASLCGSPLASADSAAAAGAFVECGASVSTNASTCTALGGSQLNASASSASSCGSLAGMPAATAHAGAAVNRSAESAGHASPADAAGSSPAGAQPEAASNSRSTELGNFGDSENSSVCAASDCGLSLGECSPRASRHSADHHDAAGALPSSVVGSAAAAAPTQLQLALAAAASARGTSCGTGAPPAVAPAAVCPSVSAVASALHAANAAPLAMHAQLASRSASDGGFTLASCSGGDGDHDETDDDHDDASEGHSRSSSRHSGVDTDADSDRDSDSESCSGSSAAASQAAPGELRRQDAGKATADSLANIAIPAIAAALSSHRASGPTMAAHMDTISVSRSVSDSTTGSSGSVEASPLSFAPATAAGPARSIAAAAAADAGGAAGDVRPPQLQRSAQRVLLAGVSTGGDADSSSGADTRASVATGAAAPELPVLRSPLMRAHRRGSASSVTSAGSRGTAASGISGISSVRLFDFDGEDDDGIGGRSNVWETVYTAQWARAVLAAIDAAPKPCVVECRSGVAACAVVLARAAQTRAVGPQQVHKWARSLGHDLDSHPDLAAAVSRVLSNPAGPSRQSTVVYGPH